MLVLAGPRSREVLGTVTDEASALRVKRMQDGMRADQVAPLAIALASEQAKAINGQIFAVRGNEVVLFSQPRPIASVVRPDGWTAEGLLTQGLPSMASKFTDLGASATVFPYDPA